MWPWISKHKIHTPNGHSRRQSATIRASTPTYSSSARTHSISSERCGADHAPESGPGLFYKECMTPSLQLIASGNSPSAWTLPLLSSARAKRHLTTPTTSQHKTDHLKRTTLGLTHTSYSLIHPSCLVLQSLVGQTRRYKKPDPYLSTTDTSTRSAPRADGITTAAAVLGRSPHPRSQPTVHSESPVSFRIHPLLSILRHYHYHSPPVFPATTLGTRMQLGTLARHHRLRHHQAPQHLLFIFFPLSLASSISAFPHQGH